MLRLRRFGGRRDRQHSGRIDNRPERRANAQSPAHISQRLRNDLSKAGFTDIKIMPSSFLVRAKDSEGNPVMMVINPDSVAEVTEQTAPAVSGAIKGAPNSQIPSPPKKQ